jgi:hypothetical protein
MDEFQNYASCIEACNMQDTQKSDGLRFAYASYACCAIGTGICWNTNLSKTSFTGANSMSDLCKSRVKNLLNIEIYEHKGIHIRKRETDDYSTIELWLEQKNLSEMDIERVVNHIHIHDHFGGLISEDKYLRIADVIFRRWQSVLLKNDPPVRGC